MCQMKISQGKSLTPQEAQFYQSFQTRIEDYLRTTPYQLIQTASVSDLLATTYDEIIDQLKKEESQIVQKRLTK